MKLFSFSRNSAYKTDSEYAAMRHRAATMAPKVLEQLRGCGITESACLKLEVFFYTHKEEKASALCDELRQMNYDVSVSRSGPRRSPFLVNGWSPKIQMSEVTVVQWTRQMCDLGQSHDCEFDGWGTTPHQED